MCAAAYVDPGTTVAMQAGSAAAGAAAGFATTHGFTTTHGFSLSKNARQQLRQQQQRARWGDLEEEEQQQQKQEDEVETLKVEQKQQQQQEQDEQGNGLGAAARGVPTNVELPVARVSSADNQLGWRGMLETSRASIGSGVLGAVSADGPGPSCAKVDLCCIAHATPGVRRMVKSVVRGLKACQDPDPSREGMGGSYVCFNEAARRVAIFKPCDEEPLAPNNPKGYVGRALGDAGWKPTVRVGEAALREVAAYLLDYGRFARVPHTTLVRASHPVFNYAQRQHLLEPTGGSTGTAEEDAAPACAPLLPPKLGSLQEFVAHLSDTSELGTGRLSKRDVHRIGILDIRLFNTDRHAGNILVCAPATPCGSIDTPGGRMFAGVTGAAPFELVPIDHGFCLPEALEPPYFEWLHWPQAMLPFDQEELDYIAALDAEADVQLLRTELPALRPQCLRVLQVGTVFLQRCAAAGLTLAAIGNLMSRPLDALDGDDSNPSELERACIDARLAMETALLGQPGSSLDGSVAGLTLEEGDEEGGESGEDDGTPAAECSAPGCCAPGGFACAHDCAALASPEGQRGCSAKRDDAGGGGLLFELEGEGGSIGSCEQHPARCGSCDSGAPTSPYSRASMDSVDGGGPPAAAARRAAMTEAGAEDGAPMGMARSVFATGGGFMWRGAKTGAGNRSPRRALGLRAVYPPPVVAVPPRATSEVLVGLDEAQWGAFMRTLSAIINERLRSGAWKAAAAGPSAVAMSCPRF